MPPARRIRNPVTMDDLARRTSRSRPNSPRSASPCPAHSPAAPPAASGPPATATPPRPPSTAPTPPGPAKPAPLHHQNPHPPRRRTAAPLLRRPPPPAPAHHRTRSHLHRTRRTAHNTTGTARPTGRSARLTRDQQPANQPNLLVSEFCRWPPMGYRQNCRCHTDRTVAVTCFSLRRGGSVNLTV